ncbi:MAG: hypothetical protein ABSG25_10070 [Bryobacteraceae bacterium]
MRLSSLIAWTIPGNTATLPAAAALATFSSCRGRPSRFWFGGFYFAMAMAGIIFHDGWLWDSDNNVLYENPDHAGYYLAYSVRLGTCVHVLYNGAMWPRRLRKKAMDRPGGLSHWLRLLRVPEHRAGDGV